MSLGYYRFIKGRLVVRPRQSPDGDSMRFIADDMTLFQGLPNYAPAKVSGGEASYQLRFQAIDTPELHYGAAKQPYGIESRNALLHWLGVDSAGWDWEKAPIGFSWEHPAAILCDSFEGYGRPIAFILKGLDDAEDGADVKLSKEVLEKTYNHHAVRTGNTYLGLYSGGLSADLRAELVAAYRAARAEQAGLWALDQTSSFKVTTLEDISPEQGSLIYPKIFRRCVDALKWAGGEFRQGHDLDDFLKTHPRENDQIVVCCDGGRLKVRLSDVIEQVNNQISIAVDLNTVEFVSK